MQERQIKWMTHNRNGKDITKIKRIHRQRLPSQQKRVIYNVKPMEGPVVLTMQLRSLPTKMKRNKAARPIEILILSFCLWASKRGDA